MSAVSLDHVVKRYETGGEVIEALKGVSFAVDPGELVAVMGPSGSGKSTLLNIIGLLDSPTEGTVHIGDRDVTHASGRELTRERRRSIGFIFQQFHLLPTLTAVENVQLPTIYASRDRRESRKRAIDLLERLGLGDRLSHRPTQLSGGQQQRVAIARALVNNPRILLADEPTGNLDQATGATILDEFTRFKEEEDVAIVAVTHDELLTDYTDRTVELVDGVLSP